MYRKIYKNITIKSLDNNPKNRTYQLDYVDSISITENIDNSITNAVLSIPAPKMNYSISNKKGAKTTVKRANTKHRFYFTQNSFTYEGKIRIKKAGVEIRTKYTDNTVRSYSGDLFGHIVEDVKLEFNAYRTLISIYFGHQPIKMKTLITDRPDYMVGNTVVKNKNKNVLDIIDTEQIPYNFIGVITRFEFDIKSNSYLIHCQDLSAIMAKKKMTMSFKGGLLSDFMSDLFLKAGYPFDTKKLIETSLQSSTITNLEDYINYYKTELNSNTKSKYYRGDLQIEGIPVYLYLDEITLPAITIKEPMTVGQIFKMLEESYGIHSYFGLTPYNNSSLLYFHSGYKYVRFNRYKLPQVFSYPLDNIRTEEAPVIDIKLDVQTYKPKLENLVVIYTSAFNGISTTLYTLDGVYCYTDKQITFDQSKQEEVRISKLITVKKKEEIEKDISTREDRREIKMIGLTNVDLYNMTVNLWKSVPDSGFSGSLTTFGDYNIHKSDRIGVKVDNLSKSGESFDYYFVDSVEQVMNSSVGINKTFTFKTKLS